MRLLEQYYLIRQAIDIWTVLFVLSFKVEELDINQSLSMKDIQFKIISKNSITASYDKASINFVEIVNYFNQNNIKIKDISTDDGDLEDVFVQLTKH